MSKAAATWEKAQIKAFSKWTQAQMSKKGITIEDVFQDFRTGDNLITLLEALSGESLGKYRKNPKMRIQMVENINKALKYIADRGVKLHAIGAEDVCDGNRKLTLGLIWTLILRFEIEDISVEEMTAKEALLYWCQKKTAPYDNVNVKEFTFSWQDGLAFCALIHAHRPNLIPYDTLSKANKAENLELAFKVAEEQLDIPRYLDAEDMTDVKPDERSVMTYVAQFFKKFASSRKAEVAGRRLSKLIGITKTNDELKSEYNEKAAVFVEWVQGKVTELEDRTFANTLEDAQEKVAAFAEYMKGEKPEKAADKAELEDLFGRIQVKLRNAGRPVFVPNEGLAPTDIQALWDNLSATEKARKEALMAELRRQEKLKALVARFDTKESKMNAWGSDQKAYFEKEEDTPTVASCKTALKLLDGHIGALESSNARIAGLKELSAEIEGLDYIEKDDVSSRCDVLETMWQELADSSSAKKAKLEEQLSLQNKMEELRLAFAELAKNTSRWYKDAQNSVTDVSFGITLAAVEAYGETLTSTDDSLSTEAGEKKAAAEALSGELSEMSITDNRYTTLSLDDLVASHDALMNALEKFKVDYAAELERQKGMEEKRLEFAGLADGFVKELESRRTAIESIEGEPEDRQEGVTAAFEDAKAALAELHSGLEACDAQCKAMSITDNVHTEYSMPVLAAKHAAFGRFVDNLNASIAEDIEMKRKREELEAEFAAKDRLENLQSEFSTKGAAAISWLDDADELSSDVIIAKSTAEVDELTALFEEKVEAGRADHLALLDELRNLNAELVENGIETEMESISARSEEVLAKVDEHKANIAAEREKQESNETLRVGFAEKANALNATLESVKQEADGISGELEEQIEAAKKIATAFEAENTSVVEEVEALAVQMDEAQIRDNDHTDLTADVLRTEFTTLKDALHKRVTDIENEALMKKMSGVSAEDLEEFKEVFETFDKDHSGTLTWYEFKGVLATLGEDLTDDEVQAVVAKYDTDNSESIEFEEFTKFMLERRVDQDNEDQLVGAFKDIAGDKDFVTLNDMASVLPAEEVEYMKENMPKVEGQEDAYNYKAWTKDAFSR